MPNPALRFALAAAGRPPGTDADLLARFAAGRDEAAFAEIVRRHRGLVRGTARRLTHDPSTADDVTQAAFLVLAAKAGAGGWGPTVGPWLYAVAARLARKARGRRLFTAPPADVPGPAADPAAGLLWAEVRSALDDALARLPASLRDPLVLCYLEGMTRDEAAAALGRSVASVKGNLARGRARLRAELEARGVSLLAALAGVLAADAGGTSAVAVARQAAEYVAVGTAPGPVLALVRGATATAGWKVAAAVGMMAVCAGGAVGLSGPGPDGPPKPHAAVPVEAIPIDAFGDPLPAGALARMGSARLRHHHLGTPSTAFSNDGKLLATGGQNEVRVWDMATGRLLREIADGDRTLWNNSLAFFPDGRWLAGTGRKTVCIWDVATGRLVREFEASNNGTAVSPDGRLIAAQTEGKAVTVWEAATGRQVARVRADSHGGDLWPHFTPDGTALATRSVDYKVRRWWNLSDGTLTKTADAPRGWLSPDERTVLVSPRDRPPDEPKEPPAFLVDVASGQERKLQGDPLPAGYGSTFSPDGKTLVANCVSQYVRRDGITVGVWDTATGALVRHLPLATFYIDAICFTPDGRNLLTTGRGHSVGLWDATTGKAVFDWPGHGGDSVIALAFTPDGQALVSGGLDRTVRLWDVATGRQLRELAGHRQRCDVVAVAPDGKRILSGGGDGCLRVQDRDGNTQHLIMQNGPPEKHTQTVNQVLALAVSPDGATATTWSNNVNQGPPLYHVWDLATGTARIERSDPSRNFGLPPLLSPDGRLALETLYEERPPDPAPKPRRPGGGGIESREVAVGVILRDAATGREVLRIRDPDRASSARCFAPDGRSLVTLASKQEGEKEDWRYQDTLHVWESATGKIRQTFSGGPAGRNWIQKIRVSPDGRTLATGHSGDGVRFWDMDAGEEVARYPSPRCGHISSLAFAPDGRSAAAGYADGTILLWPAPAAKPRQVEAKSFDGWWADLAGDDARKAYTAVRGFGAGGGSAVRFLTDRVRPVEAAPADRVRPLVADLDADFRKREAATRALAALGEAAGPELRAALAAGPAAETRQRIEQLLAAFAADPAGESLRTLRAVEALELIGTADARRALAALATGVPDARRSRDARESLARLTHRSPGERGTLVPR